MDRLAPPAGVKSQVPAIEVAEESTATCGTHCPDAPASPPASALPPVPPPPATPPDEVAPSLPPGPTPPSALAPPLALDPPAPPGAVPPVPLLPPCPGDLACGLAQADAAIRIARMILGSNR